MCVCVCVCVCACVGLNQIVFHGTVSGSGPSFDVQVHLPRLRACVRVRARCLRACVRTTALVRAVFAVGGKGPARLQISVMLLRWLRRRADCDAPRLWNMPHTARLAHYHVCVCVCVWIYRLSIWCSQWLTVGRM